MASPDQSTPASARPARGRTPILLIDDQRFVGMALARLLDGVPGFELHCCERGSDAEAAADRIRPALILQDIAHRALQDSGTAAPIRVKARGMLA